MKKILYLLIVLVVAVLGVTFTYKNPQAVSVDYYGGYHWEGPLIVLLLASFVVGVVVAAAVMSISNLKIRRRLSQTRRELKRSKQQVAQAGPLSISDSS